MINVTAGAVRVAVRAARSTLPTHVTRAARNHHRRARRRRLGRSSLKTSPSSRRTPFCCRRTRPAPVCDQLSRNALRRDLAAARAEVSTERDRDGRTVRALQSSRQALSEQNRENIQDPVCAGYVCGTRKVKGVALKFDTCVVLNFSDPVPRSFPDKKRANICRECLSPSFLGNTTHNPQS
jgi:hypothetical protein